MYKSLSACKLRNNRSQKRKSQSFNSCIKQSSVLDLSLEQAQIDVLWRKKTKKLRKTWQGDGRAYTVQMPSGDTVLRVVLDDINSFTMNLHRDLSQLQVGKILSGENYEIEILSIREFSINDTSSNSQFHNETGSIHEKNPSKIIYSSEVHHPSDSKRLKEESEHNSRDSDSSITINSSTYSKNDRTLAPIIPITANKLVAGKEINYPSLSFSTKSDNLNDNHFKAVSDAPTSLLKPVMFNDNHIINNTNSVQLSFSSNGPHASNHSTKSQTNVREDQLNLKNKTHGYLHLRNKNEIVPDLIANTKGNIFSKEMIPEFIESKLRAHQVEAIEFMYNCCTGQQHDFGLGSILADEMGLGKTLSTIIVIFILIKQGIVKNVLIVCPATLLNNWKQEFRKWIPRSANFGVIALDQNYSIDALKLFFGRNRSRVYQVFIIGYERIRSITSMNLHSEMFDLLVCDEAHRLKSKKSKTMDALNHFSNDRRILLTGTPIQNDIYEFYNLANFANSDCLGNEREFKKDFIDGDNISDLSRICEKFMLRRTGSILTQYVGVQKYEYVVFLRMESHQKIRYSELINSNLPKFDELFRSGISNLSPSILEYDYQTKNNEHLNSRNKYASEFLQVISELRKLASGLSVHESGKLLFLQHFLKHLGRLSDEKVVLVSGSTRVLDLCQELCVSERWSWLRLDGSTPQKKRIHNVNLFNNSSKDASFVFLLSTRSGGAGLNLIGASRLVLLDGDWNPAMDAQAVARIFRDGQKMPCHIYRLISTDTIDEKIFQRQLHKIDLSQSLLLEGAVANCKLLHNASSVEFSKEQLQDLFSFHEHQKCNTLETRRGTTDLRGYSELPLLNLENILSTASKYAGNVTCVLGR